MALGFKKKLLRERVQGEEAPVDSVELFFDLVFVFAVTQISHMLLAHLTPVGVLEAAMMLMAVWWVWIYNTWVTNWVDPHQPRVRQMLFAQMGLGLILSTSIPLAFEARGLWFALAYVAMQAGRSIFMIAALRFHDEGNFRNFQRITCWALLGGVFWIAGGFADGEMRVALWALALLIDYAGPSLGFYTPGLGRSATSDWSVEGGHMAERCALFIIIALGESVLVIGVTFSAMEWTPAAFAAFLSSFTATVAMWGLYFNVGAEYGHHKIVAAKDSGRIARFAYTYLHLPLAAGIVVAAVADELVLAHPLGHAELKTALAAIGGPLVYMIGNLFFKKAMFGRLPLSHLGGLAMLVVLSWLGPSLQPLTLSVATTGILVIVVLWEFQSLRSIRKKLEEASSPEEVIEAVAAEE